METTFDPKAIADEFAQVLEGLLDGVALADPKDEVVRYAWTKPENVYHVTSGKPIFILPSRYLEGGSEQRIALAMDHLKEIAAAIKRVPGTLAFSPLELPRGVNISENGRSGNVILRFVHVYDIREDAFVARFDAYAERIQ